MLTTSQASSSHQGQGNPLIVRQHTPISDYLTRQEAAEYLTSKGYPTAKGTLQKLACVGGGPEYQLFGNRALYQPEKLLCWARARLSTPRCNTSEVGQTA